VAEKDEKNKSEARFDPKPVRVGGESIVDRLLPHKKKILAIIAAGFAVYGVIAIAIHFRDSKREKHTDELAAVLDVADRPIRPPGQPEDPAAKQPTFASPAERANAVISEISKQGDAPGGPAYRASQLVTAGKLDDAIAEYKKGTNAPGLDGVLSREGLGLALEMKASAKGVDATTSQKGYEDALAAFKSMQPDDKGPGAAYAHYHQGRILVQLGKKDEAKAQFQKAKELGKDKDADLAELVEERLAMLGA
jgi:tetratricopeptide (TPR) repeat protein